MYDASANLQDHDQCSHCSTDPVPVITIHEEASNEPPPKRRKLSDLNIEGIIMDKELCDT